MLPVPGSYFRLVPRCPPFINVPRKLKEELLLLSEEANPEISSGSVRGQGCHVFVLYKVMDPRISRNRGRPRLCTTARPPQCISECFTCQEYIYKGGQTNFVISSLCIQALDAMNSTIRNYLKIIVQDQQNVHRKKSSMKPGKNLRMRVTGSR